MTKKQTSLREMSLTTAKAVSHSMTSKPSLYALQFAYEGQSFAQNFSTLQRLLNEVPANSIALAPELCLSAYSYDAMEEAACFSEEIFPQLKALSKNKAFGLTLIEKREQGYVNNFNFFHNGEKVYTQAKSKLFPLGDEQSHFIPGNSEDIRIFSINGIKIAVLICFELRFTTLWEQIKGSDLILIPAYWGKLRKKHFETLTEAIAITNQAYVLCANGADESMAHSSGIITPFGEALRDDTCELITSRLDFQEIKKMRRYLTIGLD